MNTGKIIKVNDIALVEDENKNYRVVKNKENLEEIIIQENAVEKIEENLEKYNKEIEKSVSRLNETKKNRKRNIIGNSILLLFLPIYIYLFMRGLVFLGGGEWVKLPTIFGIDMHISTVITILLEPIAILLSFNAFPISKKNIKKYLKEKNGYEKEFEFTKEQLEREKVKLKSLGNLETVELSKNIEIINADDTKYRKKLSEERENYYLYGVNADYLMKAYEKGKLEFALKRIGIKSEEKELFKSLVEEDIKVKSIGTRK